jgi:thiol-disulfide isomerase/thioredoxin
MSRRLLYGLGAVAVVVVLVVGLTQAGSSSKKADQTSIPLPEQQAQLAGAPAELAALHAQASELLAGGPTAFSARLAKLRAAGHPVVVNKWAAWCPPCRLEFPVFQRLAVKYGKQVAFVGLDGKDNDAAARQLLRQIPLSYPSYPDPRERAAHRLGAGALYPTTVFIDDKGHRTTHQGGYTDDATLERDIRRYALGRA